MLELGFRTAIADLEKNKQDARTMQENEYYLYSYASWVVMEYLGLEPLTTQKIKRKILPFPPDEAFDRVYAYWLHYLSNGPTWEPLTEAEKWQLLLDLFGALSEIYPSVLAYESTYQDAAEVPPYRNWKPTGLLRQVGYPD